MKKLYEKAKKSVQRTQAGGAFSQGNRTSGGFFVPYKDAISTKFEEEKGDKNKSSHCFKAQGRAAFEESHKSHTNAPECNRYKPKYNYVKPSYKAPNIGGTLMNEGEQRIHDRDTQQIFFCDRTLRTIGNRSFPKAGKSGIRKGKAATSSDNFLRAGPGDSPTLQKNNHNSASLTSDALAVTHDALNLAFGGTVTGANGTPLRATTPGLHSSTGRET